MAVQCHTVLRVCVSLIKVCGQLDLPFSRFDVDCTPPAGQSALHPEEEVDVVWHFFHQFLSQT